MSVLEKPIDYGSLEGELHDAIKADALYQLQNDAKLRAIEQRVPTYDRFKDMVNAAHLKPMERADMQPKLGVQWNNVASGKSSRAQDSHCFPKLPNPMVSKCPDSSSNENKILEDEVTSENSVPKRSEEFLQTWKKLASDEKRFDYLLKIRPVIFIDIFRPEIPLGVLGEIIDVCSKNLPECNDVDEVIEVLTALTRCNRFQLSTNFMNQEEKDIAKKLFRELLARGKAGDAGAAEVTVNILRKLYQITFD